MEDAQKPNSLKTVVTVVYALQAAGFFIGITEVEFGVIPLRLEYLRPLHELPRLTTMRRLVLALTRWRLILLVSAFVTHRSPNSQVMFQASDSRPWQPCCS